MFGVEEKRTEQNRTEEGSRWRRQFVGISYPLAKMNTLNIELGGTPRDRRPEYDIIDDKNLKDLHTKRSGITRCGMLVLLLSCTSFMLIGTAIGTQVKYLYNLGYLKAKADPFVYQTRFLVVGDWGTSSTTASSEQDLDLGARGTQKEVAQEMAYVGEVFQPDFVVSTGDNMFPSGLRSTQDPLFNETFTDVYLEYPSLQVDWFSVLGEKDYGSGNNNANGLDETSPLYQSTSLSANHLDSHWECCGGRDFIVKQYTHLDIFFLDSSPFVHKYYNKPWAAFQGGISSQKTKTQAQLILLEQQLEQSRAPWKVRNQGAEPSQQSS